MFWQEKKTPGGQGETVKSDAKKDDKVTDKPDDQTLEHESANKKLRSRKTDTSSQAKDKQKGSFKNGNNT